ncbi:MAG: hypothetical protein ACTHYD_04175 [Canibacter sp.]
MSVIFAGVQIVIAVLAGLFCFGTALVKRGPNDYTLGATALVTLLLLAQVVVAIVMPFVGNAASGDLLEFWMYLIVAIAIPPIAIVWALIDKSLWANAVLGLVHLAIAVMVYRMLVIWG